MREMRDGMETRRSAVLYQGGHKHRTSMGRTRRDGRRAFLAVCCAAAGAVAGLAAPAQADLVAYWNFNDLPTGLGSAPNPIPADFGDGAIVWSGWNGGLYAQGNDGFATEANALFGDAAGTSVNFRGTFDGEGGTIHFQFSMTGLEDLVVSYATATNSPTSAIHSWKWSVDGVNFTGAESISDSGFLDWEVQTIDFSSIALLNDADAVTLSLVLSEPGGGAPTFSTLFDNVQINANVIPAPAASALLCVAGLSLASRRRRLR